MGQLQRQLRQGEFDIFKSVPMFESDFVQISKRGTLSNMHGCPQIMTVGIANTNPFDPIPNVMLVAQLVGDCEKHVGCDQDTEGEGDRDTKELELTRLLPLKLVKISIHNRDKLQLRVKLITGRSFYLQLWAPPDKQEELFGYWEELIYLLRPPVEAYSSTHAVPAGDLFMSVFEEMDRSPKVAYFQIREGQEEVSIGSIHALEATAALSAASARGKQAQQDFHKGMTVTKSASEQLTTALAGAATEWPGGRKTNAVIAGAANTCPPECTASGSAVLSPEDSVRMATAGAAPASKIGGGEETGVSASPTSAPTLRREEAGRQVHLPPACTEVPNGFSSPAGMVADSHQRAGGDKIPHQPGDSTSDSLRALGEEEEGCCSSAHSRHDTTCKEVSPAHAPTAEESRASHKPGTESIHTIFPVEDIFTSVPTSGHGRMGLSSVGQRDVWEEDGGPALRAQLRGGNKGVCDSDRSYPELVKISIHNRDKLQLRVKLITGRSFYLQLWAPPDKQEELFGYWEELIYLLRPPVEAYSSTHAVPAGDLFMSVFEEMDRSPKVAYFQIREGQEEVSIGSIHALEATAALSAASARGKQAQQDFHKGMTVTKSASEQLTTALAGAATEWPGGRKTNAVIAGAANTCPPECTASGSAVLSPEDSVRMATAGAAPASKISGGEETGVSASPTSAPTLRREEAGRQVHLPPACTEVPNGFSSPAGMVADSHQRAGGDKIPHQPGDSTSDSLRALGEEEEGCCSSAHSRHDTTCKEVSPAHAPTAEESRASHKPGGTKVHVPGLRYAAGSARCGTTSKPE
ncbi:Protein FAM71A [Manis javanica]|nr:Protein FAM71A [Manis javanica]